jgi:hypothetical protein
MTRPRSEGSTIGVLRHSCDLDLVLFFYRHPRALLTCERLAAYVGYDLNQVERSLDLLTEASLLERSPNPSPARMYVLKRPGSGWLESLLEIASTRDGRRTLIQAMQAAAQGSEDDQLRTTNRERSVEKTKMLR